jgi:hypothetical protein
MMEPTRFPTYHLVAQEDLGLVNAALYGQDPTSHTLHAAIEAIGNAHVLLALLPLRPLALRGVLSPELFAVAQDVLPPLPPPSPPAPRTTRWTLDQAVTIPSHVPLMIAPGVTVGGEGFFLITSDLITWGEDWYQGTGGWSYYSQWLRL